MFMRVISAIALPAGLLASLTFFTGCEVDGWMFDPSVVGRWEHTPTAVPILDRIEVIERDTGDFVETSSIQADDLIPEVTDYEIGPGDQVLLEIFDLYETGTPAQLARNVDSRGFIDIPQVGRINILGLTADEIREAVRVALRDAGLIEDALVSATITAQREQTFSVFGAISGVGRYFIPQPDYRLLEALTEAGGLSPIIRKIFVIRQVPLTDAAERGMGVTPADKPAMPIQAPDRDAEQPGIGLEQLIEGLTRPEEDGDPSPGFFADQDGVGSSILLAQADQDQPQDPEAVIPLIEEESQPAASPVAPLGLDEGQQIQAAGRWMFLNGEWVRVARRTNAGVESLPEGADALEGLQPSDLVTQRIIEIPTAPLLQGKAEYNIVIRPGDVIRIPPPVSGLVYIGGPGIARAGVYSLPQNGRLTLTKAIISAGGLSQIAIPERLDLTRMIGDDRQATIRLNARAIFEGTQPDIFLKPDDVINVGTNFFATPLAVIRNGFRMSYGFGFLLDRNFGNDVFGAPPSNRGF